MVRRDTNQRNGVLGEDLACSFLIKKGLAIIARNFRVRGGEVDIIARDGDELVFVEVKTRTRNVYGYPEEAVHHQKMLRLSRAIRAYLVKHRIDGAYRCDVVAVHLNFSTREANVRHIRGIELPLS